MKLARLISAALVAAIMLPVTSYAGSIPPGARASDVEHLKRIFSQHVFFGRRFDRRLRAATGNPNIVVFDHRLMHEDGSQCSYITYRGKRAIVCD